MNSNDILSRLTGTLGQALTVLPETDSTNLVAKELANHGAKHGTLVVADAQTAGRCRKSERRFFSPTGTGVYMSLVLRPDIPTEKLSLLTPCVAVVVAQAIEALCDVKVFIKWVNDLHINSKKICGILCESSFDMTRGKLDYVVVGIGINVGKMNFPDEIASIATSIGNECALPPSRETLISEICNRFESVWKTDFMLEYRSRSDIIGHNIDVHTPVGSYRAKAIDIDKDGALIVEAGGEIIRVNAGEISIRQVNE